MVWEQRNGKARTVGQVVMTSFCGKVKDTQNGTEHKHFHLFTHKKNKVMFLPCAIKPYFALKGNYDLVDLFLCCVHFLGHALVLTC